MPQLEGSTLTLGGNLFHGVPFPIVLNDYYIHLRMDADEPICQIWKWDSTARVATRQPDPGGGPASAIRLAPYGNHGLALELAPDAEEGWLAGITALGAVRIVCTPESMQVWRGDKLSVELKGNTISGMPVGVALTDTGFSLGSQLPAGFMYQLDYVNKLVQINRMVTDPRNPIVENARFVHCRIEGPAVVAGEGLVVHGGNWDLLGAPIDSRFITLPNPGWLYGVVICRNVEFQDCDLVNVAFTRNPPQ